MPEQQTEATDLSFGLHFLLVPLYIDKIYGNFYKAAAQTEKIQSGGSLFGVSINKFLSSVN